MATYIADGTIRIDTEFIGTKEDPFANASPRLKKSIEFVLELYGDMDELMKDISDFRAIDHSTSLSVKETN